MATDAPLRDLAPVPLTAAERRKLTRARGRLDHQRDEATAESMDRGVTEIGTAEAGLESVYANTSLRNSRAIIAGALAVACPDHGAEPGAWLRDHRLALPDDEALLDELMPVRLRESAPGVYRLDHDGGQHDDRAVSLGLAALALAERATSDYGSVSSMVGISRAALGSGVTRMPGADPLAAYSRARTRGEEAQVAAALRAQTPVQRRHGIGLIVRGSANDPGH